MNQFGIEVFSEFGRYNYVKTESVLDYHTHVDSFEICYLIKGNQQYIVGELVYNIHGGDVFVTYPNEFHGTGKMPEQKGILYWMVIHAPVEGQDFLGLPHADATELYKNLLKIPSHQFKGNADCKRLLQRVLATYLSPRTALSRIQIKTDLISFLLHIIDCANKNSYRQYSPDIEEILSYINSNIMELFTLADLAEKTNLSVSHFKHKFKHEVGMPPAEYFMRKKIDKAKELIQKGDLLIKDIAYDLGFTSPSYFSTVFKQYAACSPLLYMEKKGRI